MVYEGDTTHPGHLGRYDLGAIVRVLQAMSDRVWNLITGAIFFGLCILFLMIV